MCIMWQLLTALGYSLLVLYMLFCPVHVLAIPLACSLLCASWYECQYFQEALFALYFFTKDTKKQDCVARS